MANIYTLQHHRPMPNPGPALANQRIATPQTSMVITSTRDRGHQSCQIGYPTRKNGRVIPAWLPQPLDLYWPMGYTTVKDGADTLFSGRASGQPELEGGDIKAITAAGWWEALNDIYFTSTDSTTTTSGAIITSIILQAIGYVSISSEYWIDPGVSHAPSEFNGQRGGSVVQTLLNEGNGSPLDLQFWPGDNDTVIAEIHDRNPPDQEDYSFPWYANKNIINLTYDPLQMYGHFLTVYTPSGGSETETDWYPPTDDTTFFDKWGFDRYLKITGGQMTADGATQLRDTTYAVQSQPQWGGTIKCSAQYPLLGINGRPVSRAHVRAGQWVRVHGLTEPDGVTPIMLQIQQSVNDLMADTLSLTVAQGMTQQTLQERIEDTTAAVRTGRNPISAAKWAI